MRSVPEAHETFDVATEALLTVAVRPEFRVEQAPSPQRLAPRSFTLTAEAIEGSGSHTVEALSDSATGRFVILHDPDGVDEWEGSYRVVIFARCDVEPELLSDPLVHEVAWSWVTEALDDRRIAQLGGTVTISSGTSFGTMAERPGDGLVEIRASWTPLLGSSSETQPDMNVQDMGSSLTEHMRVWINILAKLAGLPPVPPGVSTLAGYRTQQS